MCIAGRHRCARLARLFANVAFTHRIELTLTPEYAKLGLECSNCASAVAKVSKALGR